MNVHVNCRVFVMWSPGMSKMPRDGSSHRDGAYLRCVHDSCTPAAARLLCIYTIIPPESLQRRRHCSGGAPTTISSTMASAASYGTAGQLWDRAASFGVCNAMRSCAQLMAFFAPYHVDCDHSRASGLSDVQN